MLKKIARYLTKAQKSFIEFLNALKYPFKALLELP
jgi:hypothetical protein